MDLLDKGQAPPGKLTVAPREDAATLRALATAHDIKKDYCILSADETWKSEEAWAQRSVTLPSPGAWATVRVRQNGQIALRCTCYLPLHTRAGTVPSAEMSTTSAGPPPKEADPSEVTVVRVVAYAYIVPEN
eukprot:681554-Alexandrium_andersonii.AAC.1